MNYFILGKRNEQHIATVHLVYTIKHRPCLPYTGLKFLYDVFISRFLLINGGNMNASSYIVIHGEASWNGSRLGHERNRVSRIVKSLLVYDHLILPRTVSNLDLSMEILKTSEHHQIRVEDLDEGRKLAQMDFLLIYNTNVTFEMSIYADISKVFKSFLYPSSYQTYLSRFEICVW